MKLLREITDANVRNRARTMHDSLSPHYQGFTSSHLHHLKYYQKDSLDLNSFLWNKHKDNEDFKNLDSRDSANWESDAASMDSAVHQHKTPSKLVVWSGTRHDPRQLKNEQGVVHHPAFLSTSLNTTVARNFAPPMNQGDGTNHQHILKIHVPKGHPGAYVANISRYGEKEFILPRGTNLQHIKSEEVPTEVEHIKRFIHHMRVV